MPFAWVDCCNWGMVPEEYHQVIHDVVRGTKRVKKLQAYAVPTFRVKINYADRLIFRTKVINNRPYMEVTAVVTKHEYDWSQALTKPLIVDVDANIHLQCAKHDEDYLPEAIDSRIYHHDTFIRLSTAQQGPSIEKVPLLLTAGPGGGKTLVGEELMRQALVRCHDQDINPARVAYVTQSAALAYEEQQGWGHTEDVSFFSYHQFVLFHDPSIAEYTHVGAVEFITWCSAHIRLDLEVIKNKLKTVKTKGFLPDQQDFLRQAQKNISRIYQEMRAMPREQAVYEGYGVRSSMFFAVGDYNPREWLFDLRQKYQNHLKKNQQYDLVFHVFAPRFLYHFLFVDEIYDLPRIAWEILAKATINYQVCVAGDTHQRLDTPLSLRPVLLNMFHEMAGHYFHEILPGSYRCTRDILQIVNVFIELKQRLRGGIADADECTHISLEHALDDDTPSVYLSSSADASLEGFKHLCASPECVVITHEHLFAEARARFNTQYVGTPAMLKGLEKDFVVFYKFTEDELGLFKKSHQYLQRIQNQPSPQYRSSREESSLEFECLYNDHIVAVSRARKKLFLIDDGVWGLPQILAPLRKVIDKCTHFVSLMPSELASSDEDWLKEVHVLLKNERTVHLAQAIYCEKLGYSAESFELLKSDYTHKSSTRWLQPIEPAPMITARNALGNTQNSHLKKMACSAEIQGSPLSVVQNVSPVTAVVSPTRSLRVKKKKVFLYSDISHFLLPAWTADEKVLNTLAILYKNFTHENLVRWCVSEKQVFELLSVFERPGVTYSCRFIDAILQCPERRVRFCDFLCHSDAYVEGVSILSLLQSQNNGVQLLHSAVIWNAWEYVQLCIDKNISLSDRDHHGRTPLFLALFYGRIGMTRMLCRSFAASHVMDEAMISTPTSDMIPFYTILFLYSNEWILRINDKYCGAYDFLSHIYSQHKMGGSRVDELQEEDTLDAHYVGAERSLQVFSPLMNAILLHDMHKIRYILRRQKVNLNQFFGKKKITALLLAISCGLLDVVQELCAFGADPACASRDGITPVLLAAQLNFQSICRYLIGLGVGLNHATSQGVTPLISAIYFQRTMIVRDLLLAGAFIQYDDPGLQPLDMQKTSEIHDLFKTHQDKIKMAVVLSEQISQGSIAALTDPSGVSWKQSIHLLALKNVLNLEGDQCLLEEILNDFKSTVQWISALKISKNPTIIQEILNVLFINFQYDFGHFSILRIAARAAYGNLFFMFCEKYNKAQFTQHIMTRETAPLADAVSYSNLKVVSLLMRYGACTDLRTSGMTLLEYAFTQTHNPSFFDVVKCLLDDPRIQNNVRQGLEDHVFGYIMQTKNLDALHRLLFIRQATQVDFYSQLLFLAVDYDFVEGVRVILKGPVNLDFIQKSRGKTALMCAVQTNSQEMFDCLIVHGANVKILSSKGRNILQIARAADVDERFYHHISAIYHEVYAPMRTLALGGLFAPSSVDGVDTTAQEVSASASLGLNSF